MGRFSTSARGAGQGLSNSLYRVVYSRRTPAVSTYGAGNAGAAAPWFMPPPGALAMMSEHGTRHTLGRLSEAMSSSYEVPGFSVSVTGQQQRSTAS